MSARPLHRLISICSFLAILNCGFMPTVAHAAGKAPAKTTKQAKGSLIIESTTKGAEILIDGKNFGTIPFKPTSLTVGRHHIVVRKIGFLDYTNDITITSGKGTKLSVDLVPVASVVNMASIPAKATILIDGVDKGKTPTKVELKTGTYNIEFRLEGYLPFKKQIKIEKLGQTIPISATLAQDKLGNDDLDLALPMDDLPPAQNGEDLALDSLDLEPLPDELPLETAPAKNTPPKDDLALDSLDLEPLPDELPLEAAPAPTAPVPPVAAAPAHNDGNSDSAVLLAVPAGVATGAAVGAMAGAKTTAKTTAQKDKKWYKSWWFWTITGAVVVGAAVGIGVGASQANQTETINYDGFWTLGSGYQPAQH